MTSAYTISNLYLICYSKSFAHRQSLCVSSENFKSHNLQSSFCIISRINLHISWCLNQACAHQTKSASCAYGANAQFNGLSQQSQITSRTTRTAHSITRSYIIIDENGKYIIVKNYANAEEVIGILTVVPVHFVMYS